MKEIVRRLRYLWHRRQELEGMESEMAFHREMAERAGQKNFGNGARLGEEAREAWGWTWVDRLGQDLRFAARMLWRAPGFTVTAVLVLAVGIGVNVTAFSLFNLALLRPIPVKDPATLLGFERRGDGNIGMTPYGSMIFYRDHARTLSAVMAMMGGRLEQDGDAGPASVNYVTPNYFRELGTSPYLGRLLDAGRDGARNAAPVVVLSHGFWERQYDGDASVVGRVIHLNRKPVTVVGVLPEAFGSLGGSYSDVWVPLDQQPYYVEGSKLLSETGGGSLAMWGRMAPGVTAAAVEDELRALASELRRQHPKDVWNGEYMHSEPGGRLRTLNPMMTSLLEVVGVLLLLILTAACANLGGLLVARGVSRGHEMHIRVAIGATRKRLFRQLLTESLLLAGLGAAAGMLLGYVVLRVTLTVTEAPRWMSAAPDWRVFLFTLALSLVALLVFGLAPALEITSQRQRRGLVRQALIAAQVAASCVLLIVAALLVRGVQRMLYTDPGFGYEQVISIDPALGEHGYTAGAGYAYLSAMRERVRGLPGVTSVALTRMTPLNSDKISYMQVTVKGKTTVIYPDFVDTEFFHTMGIPLLRGRNLLPGERNAVVLSEALARRKWPGEDPVGKRFSTDGPGGDTVVGIVGNAHIMGANDSDAVEMYTAVKPEDMADAALVVKTAGAPEQLPAEVKAIAASLDAKVFPTVRLLKAGFRASVVQAEQAATMVSVMGLTAVLLAAVGLVGLVSYAVSQRWKELAIRFALGAGRGAVLTAVLRQFTWPVLAGLLLGVGGAAALASLLRRVLYGVSHLDPLGYAGAISVLLAILGLAALIPARRALRVDMARALHHE